MRSTVHRAAGAVAVICGAGLFTFVGAALQAESGDGGSAFWLWTSAGITFVLILFAGLIYFLTSPSSTEGEARQVVSKSPVGGGVMQTAGDVTAGGDIILGTQEKAQRDELRPLEIVGSEVDESGHRPFVRLKVYNPNDQPVHACYGQVLSCKNSNPKPYSGPPEGYHFPWSTYGGNGIVADIGGKGHDFLDIARALSPDGAKGSFCYLNPKTGQQEDRFFLVRGDYDFMIELGSRSDDTQPQKHIFCLRFGGGDDLKIDHNSACGVKS